MSATEELRRMLDERGVGWTTASGSKCYTAWATQHGMAQATDYGEGGDIVALMFRCTPEQAIAATLDSCSRSSNCTNGERTNGTCRDVRSADHIIAFECSECGCWVAYDEYWETGIYVPDETGQEHIHPRYCPNCGAEVGA